MGEGRVGVAEDRDEGGDGGTGRRKNGGVLNWGRVY